jgi:hypothetical protein
MGRSPTENIAATALAGAAPSKVVLKKSASKG